MKPASEIQRLIEIMEALRTPTTGCSWDLAQTHKSLARYALEEAYEVVDAIERDDMDDLRDELGDLLLQVVFHARVSEEAGGFAFGDVVEGVTAKMVRRHPHVFANASPRAVQDQTFSDETWEGLKTEERMAKGAKERGLLADISGALPGLSRAVKLQKRAATVGFDWNDTRLVVAKIREEIDEIEDAMAAADSGRCTDQVEAEIGDLIFAVANLARHAGVDPETAVRATNRKFERRFAYIEDELAARGSSTAVSSLEEMDALWDEAKTTGL